MASNRVISPSIFVIFVFFSLFSSPSLALRDLPSASSDEKVSLGLYYETLCPYSANFIINYLAKILDNGIIDIVDLNLVPWGNAKIRGNSTFDCQHGPSECLLNTIQACAINAWPKLNEHFAFINCVETLVYNHKFPKWETCYGKLGLDAAPISSCYVSGNGTELELKYAAETESLVPPHKYVPWVVVDGEPLYEEYENFVSYVCKAYKGTALPSACSNASLTILPREKPENNAIPVCYLEKETANSKPTLLKRFQSSFNWILKVLSEGMIMR
ncbi:hypothetical protein V2J09_018202 [Rumex salicifolius]